MWYPKGANVHADTLQNKWFGHYRVQYLLPNNTILLVTVDKFDLNPFIVNIKKLKTYRCPEEGLPDLSSSEQQTKIQLIEASFQNEDEPTSDVGTHPVILAVAIQPVPNPNTALYLDTSSLQPPIPNPSHPQPQGGNLTSISKSLLFQMARVSTRVPYQPQPRTITTLEATTILSSFTFLQLSHLLPSTSLMSAQRVVVVPLTERPSTEWRGIWRRRHGSTTLSVLSDRRVSAREKREQFPYQHSAKTPHVPRAVSRARMALKSSQTVPSPKSHSPMAQAVAGMYMTYH